ncbi:MAG TPA: SGNH/GDSL hydrolase family protein [Actinomycetota bacterium]|nr:SGNH/GDSL hydrolase family protein [Actinomycetota bacterium]
MAREVERVVALGDSMTEGLMDPDGEGGHIGWADRLAEHLATERGEILYANLAVRGRRTHEVREQQLEPALALVPDLVSVVVGMNDILRTSFEIDQVMTDIDHMIEAFTASGARVLTMTYGDPVPVNPYARFLRGRMMAFNARLRQIAARHGSLLLDFEDEVTVSDPRFWCEDRLHANSEGHRRIAAAVAGALGIDVEGPRWNEPLPPLERGRRRERIVGELAWARRHLAPWVTRRLRKVSSGDGVEPKRPTLEPVRRT